MLPELTANTYNLIDIFVVALRSYAKLALTYLDLGFLDSSFLDFSFLDFSFLDSNFVSCSNSSFILLVVVHTRSFTIPS